MAQRVTTQQLHDTLTEGFHSIDKRLSTLERDVQGSNGEGLWDMIKQLRKEYREGAERHREEHRRMWERITEVEGRVYQHSGIQQGEQSGAQGRRARREGDRRSIEVWLFGSVLAVVALLQGLQVIGVV